MTDVTNGGPGRAKIGVVTVTYNSAAVIDGFMQSALQQTHADFILYIVDNASKDATLRRLENFIDPRIRIIANSENLGVAEGNNQGIRLSREAACDFVLLINNDTEFGPDLFAAMIQASDRHKADLLVPKMMFFEPKNVIWCAGGRYNPWRGFITVHGGEGEIDRGQYDQAVPIKYAPTCCMLIRSPVFDRVGLMDSHYFVYFDDTDFCWRANKQGLRFWYDPSGTLYHKVSSLTGGSVSEFTIRYATRNKIYFVLKNLSFSAIAYCLVLYQLIFLFKWLAGGDSWAIYGMKMRAYFAGIRMYLDRKRDAAPG